MFGMAAGAAPHSVLGTSPPGEVLDGGEEAGPHEPGPTRYGLYGKFYETFGDDIADELVEWFNQVAFAAILAHVSRNATVRLNTSAPGRESTTSLQKYP